MVERREDHLLRGTCCHNLPPRVSKCAFVAHRNHEVRLDDHVDADDAAAMPVQCLGLCLAEHRMWQREATAVDSKH